MTPQQLQELSTDRPFTAKLKRQAQRRPILATCGGQTWFQWGDWRLPRRLNWLWRVLAKRR